MPLVFAGTAPDTPLLLDPIDSPTLEAEDFRSGLTLFEEALYLARPEIVFLFSPTASTMGEFVTVQAAPTLTASLSLFGEFSHEKHWHGAPHIAATLLSHAEQQQIPWTLSGSARLDASSTAALSIIGSHGSHAKIVPIGSSHSSREAIIASGSLIHEYAMLTTKRVACIALGHLAAAHSEASPFGFLETSSSFDTDVRSMLTLGDTAAFQYMSHNSVTKHQSTLYSELLMLTAACGNMPFLYNEYAYDVLGGIGYTTGSISIS